MAAEYVLVPKHKYEQFEKDSLSTSTAAGAGGSESLASTSEGEGDHPTRSHTAATKHFPQVERLSLQESDVHGAPKARRESDGNGEQISGKGGNLFMDTDLDVGDSDDGSNQLLSPNDYDVDDVQSSFSASELKYVQPILSAMQEHDKVLSWNKQTGEIELQGRLIADSNVIELLKDTLTASLHPAGKMEFYRGLDMLKIKLKCIKHSKNKALLTLMREDKIMPKKKTTTKPVKRLHSSNKAVNGWISWSW